jgi:hypothetical protein
MKVNEDVIEISIGEEVELESLRRETDATTGLSGKVDDKILNKIDSAAATAGLVRNTVRHVQGEAYLQIWDYIIYSGPYMVSGGVAAVGAAAFIRNTLGVITEWRNLRRGRRFFIQVNGKHVEIPDGATEAEVLAAIEDAHKP